MGVVEAASRLFGLLAEKDDTFTRHLRPGMPEDEIRRLVMPAGVELPREVIDFYSRFSLPPGYHHAEGQPTLYGIYSLLSLDDGVEQYCAQKREGRYQSPEAVQAGSARIESTAMLVRIILDIFFICFPLPVFDDKPARNPGRAVVAGLDETGAVEDAAQPC